MGKDAFGHILRLGDGASPEVFTAVAKMKDLDGPGFSRESYDATTHDSADHYEESEPGIKSGGELSAAILYDPSNANHRALFTAYESTENHNWQVVTPVAGTTGYWVMSFTGHIKDFKYKGPVKGLIEADMVIKISGKVTWSDIVIS
jgi:predicted secreted protein